MAWWDTEGVGSVGTGAASAGGENAAGRRGGSRPESGSPGAVAESCGLTPEVMRALSFPALAEHRRLTGLKQLQIARHLSDVLALSDEAVFLVDDAWRIVDFNSAAERIFALASGARGSSLADLLPGLTYPITATNPLEHVASALRGDGAAFPARVRVAGDRALGIWTVLVKDLDERRLAERELDAVEQLILAVNGADSTEAALSEALRGIREMIGWEAADAWLPDGRHERLCASVSLALDGRNTDLADDHLTQLRGEGLAGRAWSSERPEWMAALQENEFCRRHGAGRAGYRTGLAIPLFVGGEFLAVLCFYTRRALGADERLLRLGGALAVHLGAMLQRKRVEDRLHYLAHHDPLTGAANRALLCERIEHARMDVDRRGRLFAIVHLDLDRFKSVNDAFGYPAGDRLLQQVAGRLRGSVRGNDTVARLGSDEFALLLTDLPNVDSAACIAQKILDCVADGFELGGQAVMLSASAGITIYPHDARETDDLLHNAGIAMSRAKDGGGGSYRFHTEEMSVRVRERLSLERDLHRALRDGGFDLYYQPIFDLASGAFTHVEALARWFHPRRGAISPAEFIPLAEDTGMIVELGQWVLRTACRQAVEWQRCGRLPAPHVAVNVSARELCHGEFVARLRTVLEETGCNPSGLTIEITESLFIDEDMIDVLRAVSATGVKLSIDDFGTGYSNLSCLRRLPLDYLKIDRSFIHDVPQDPEATTLVAAILGMARALRLNVVAEGVETQAQLRHLQEHGCDLVQGYYLGVPMPAQEVTRLFRGRPPAAQKRLMKGISTNQPM